VLIEREIFRSDKCKVTSLKLKKEVIHNITLAVSELLPTLGPPFRFRAATEASTQAMEAQNKAISQV